MLVHRWRRNSFHKSMNDDNVGHIILDVPAYKSMVFADSSQISLTGSAKRFPVHQRPYISETQSVAVGVSVDVRMRFHVWDDLVDEIIDLSLVCARRETVDIVNASKLSHPDGLLVSVPVMINIHLDAIKAVFIDVDRSEVPLGRYL